MHGRMLRDVEGKSGLAHTGPSTDDYEISGLKPGGIFIEVLEARGDTRDCLFFVVEMLDHLEGGLDDVLHSREWGLCPLLRDFEDHPLSLVHKIIGVRAVFVDPCGDIRRSPDEVA